MKRRPAQRSGVLKTKGKRAAAPLPPPLSPQRASNRPDYNTCGAFTLSDKDGLGYVLDSLREVSLVFSSPKQVDWGPSSTKPPFPSLKNDQPTKDARSRAFRCLAARQAWNEPASKWLLIDREAFRRRLSTIIQEEMGTLKWDDPNSISTEEYNAYNKLLRMLDQHDAWNVLQAFTQWSLDPRHTGEGAECIRIEEARRLCQEVSRQRKIGLSLRKQAKWIGLIASSAAHVNAMTGRVVFEREDDHRAAVKEGLVDADDSVALGDEYSRLCAPTQPENLAKPVPFIFWTKENAEDNSPSWKKAFGAIIYNRYKERFDPFTLTEAVETSLAGQLEGMAIAPHADTDTFETDTQRVQFVRFRVAEDSVVRGVALNRSRKLADCGVMAKTAGSTSTYGQFGQRIIVPAKSAKEFALVDELRVQVRDAMPEWQLYEHAFLQAFMPPIATKIEEAAAKAPSRLLGLSGMPQPAAFATFGYSAGAHVDKDDSPTIGRVLRRDPERVDRGESNFFYASHKLLVELDKGALWVWNARDDYHGTTVNSVSLDKTTNWSKLARMDPEAAQWTLVSVFPLAVTRAAERAEDNDD